VETIGLFWNGKLVTNVEELRVHISEARELEIKFLNKIEVEELYPKEVKEEI